VQHEIAQNPLSGKRGAAHIQAGLWAAVAPFLVRGCREFGPTTRLRWVALLLLSATVIALLAELTRGGMLGPTLTYPLAHHSGRILVLYIIAFILLCPGPLSMGLIWQRLRMIELPHTFDWPAIAALTCELLKIRERLAQILLALGLTVGALTLATGALRNAVLAYGTQTSRQFPAFESLLGGAVATVLLATFYFPAYFALQRTSQRLADSTYPLTWVDQPDQNWYTDRTNFITLLKLEVDPVQSFRTGVVILTPLIGSLLATLLPVNR
jgi:hypothetical protein